MIAVVDAKPWHCGQMVRQLRAEDRDGTLACGVNAHRELRQRLDGSAFARAVLIDGRLAALGGLVGTVLAHESWIWLVIAPWAIRRNARALGRLAVIYVRGFMQLRHGLYATVFPGDIKAMRLVEFLGFKDLGERMPYGRGELAVWHLVRE